MMWINIIAVIAAPIAAVVIGQKLQDRAEKRKDKMAISSFSFSETLSS